MKQLSDVLIVGAGIVGAAIAFAFTRAGNLRVTVLEKGPLAAGMTRRSAGVAHLFQFHPTLIQFALDSFAFYQNAAQHLGPSKSEFVTTGAALIGGAADAAKIFARAQMLAPFTRDVTTTARGALAVQYPGVSPNLQAGLFTPRAGFADAVQMTQRFIHTAQARGLHVATGTLVKQIQVANGRVRGVTTTTGTYEAPFVIVAAGGWSDKVVGSAGPLLPLKSQRGAVLFYEQPPELTQGHPLFLDVEGELFLRPHAYRLSAAGWMAQQSEMTNLDALDEFVSPTVTARVSQFVEQCLAVKDIAPRRAHTIVYSNGANGLPLLGRVDGADGLFVAAGFGANAFAVAPAVGDAMARMVIDGTAPLAVSFFASPDAKEKL